MKILNKILLSSLIALQIIGPSWVLAIQTSAQETGKSEALIAGLRGVVTVTPGANDRPGYTPKYRSILAIGDVISTEEESVAEILLENQGLVTIQEYSEAMLNKNDDGGLSVRLEVGTAEWSFPIKSQDGAPLTFTTPNIRAATGGGLVTVEVQPTLAEIARISRPRDSFLVRTSLHVQASPSNGVGLLETFCVNEGDLTIEYPGAQQGLWQEETVVSGECRGFLNGQPRAMTTAMGNGQPLVDWREVCTVRAHCEIPEPTKKLIAKKQTGQALALERALVGSDSEEVEVDEQVVLATTGQTTGLLLAAVTPGPGNGNNGDVILPCTGDPAFCNGPDGNGGGNPPPPPPQFPDPNVPGMPPASEPFFNVGGPSASGPGPFTGSGFPSNIQTGDQLWPANGMPGGEGLLSFINGDFTADKELLLADSGILADAPHLGKAPQNSLLVRDLNSGGAGRPSNQKLPIQLGAFAITLPDFNESTPTVQLGVEGTSRQAQAQQLSQFARDPMIDPDNNLASVPAGGCPFSPESCFQVILAAGVGGLEQPDPKPEPGAGIDGTIQVRSASTMDPRIHGTRVVTLKKGVVLGGNTQVSLALQEKTNDSFSGLETTLGQAIQGSAVSILGEPGEPAIVRIEDRALAILGGSRIQPADSNVTTALLAILDGRLHGPTTPSVIGKDSAGADILRQDVSPIIEMIGSSAEVTTGVMVGSTAGPGQTGDLDQALLEASSPLVAMINSSLTTASDFGRVAGQNAKLDATLLPGDALVRLNASSLMINGNLFSVTGGGQLNVNGSLLSVQGGSMVTLAGGTFVHVGSGSMFSLTNGALVDFGAGNNVVNVSNTLCASGGCFTPFSNPAYQVAGNPADFSAPAGFNPFVDLGTFPDGSVNTVNVAQDTAILSVEPGGSIQIQ